MRYLADPQVQVALVWTGLAFLGGGLVTLPFAYRLGKRAGKKGIVLAKAQAFETGREAGEEHGRIAGVWAYHAERTAKANATRARNKATVTDPVSTDDYPSTVAVAIAHEIAGRDAVRFPVPATFVDTGEGEE